MRLIGVEFLSSVVTKPGFAAKMVFNEHGAVFFPVTNQHRDIKAQGISYEDDYKGNALAAMLGPGRIEVRYHRAFADLDVTRILSRLRAESMLSFLADWKATYQGRPLPSAVP